MQITLQVELQHTSGTMHSSKVGFNVTLHRLQVISGDDFMGQMCHSTEGQWMCFTHSFSRNNL